MKMAYTITTDLEISEADCEASIDTHRDLKKLKNMNYVVVPSLDVCPLKPREDFAKLCYTTFRYASTM